MFGLINTIFEYVVLSIQFLSKTGSLAKYDYKDDYRLAGHDTIRKTAKQKREEESKKKISQSAELEQVADGAEHEKSDSAQTETTSEKLASAEVTDKKADKEIVDFEYVDVEAKRARYAELLKEKEKRNLTKEENEEFKEAKQYRSGYAKFNDKIDEIVDKKFKNAPRLKRFIKGASDFLSSRGISLVFAGISLSFVLGSLILAATAPVIVPVVIGLTATGLGLGLIFLGKAFVSMVTGDRALQQAKQDYSLSEEIKREKGDLEETLTKNPELKVLLGNSMLTAFGQNGRGSYSTGGIIAKDLLYEAPSFGLAIASSAISLNVPAILVTIFSTILFRASSIKQSLAAAKSYTEFGNYMAQLEESLGIRNATPEQKAEILGRIRQLRSALNEFLNDPKNKENLKALNEKFEDAKAKISKIESDIKEINERILKLEEELNGVQKTGDSVNVDAILKHKQLIEEQQKRRELEREKLGISNKLKNNEVVTFLEKVLVEAIEKEPFIKPELKKPSLWESFKRVYNPRNLFSYERNCEMQTPFGADSKFYKAYSPETYDEQRKAKKAEAEGEYVSRKQEKEGKRTQAAEIERKEDALYDRIYQDKLQKIQSFHKDDESYKSEDKQHELRMKAHKAAREELERQKISDEQKKETSFRSKVESSSTNTSTVRTPTRL